MRVSACGLTDVGLKRTKNEDNFLLDRGMGLFILADGMGGHKGGGLASQLAVEAVRGVFKNYIREHDFITSPRVVIEEAYVIASSRVFDKSMEDDNRLYGMGTTLVTAYIHKDEIFIGNVGDSRGYFYNKHYMWQMTEDHSLLNDHIRAGLIKDSDIKDFQAKNVITRSVGFEREVACDIIRKKIEPGDSFLLCSDGLSGLVDDENIYEICRNNPSKKAVELCIEAAKENGGDDNITVVIIDVK